MLHQLTFRLSYGECDPAGIIYYGAYHPWMERTYSDWSFEQDLRTDQIDGRHGLLIASRASSMSYERSPRVYDRMRCEMRLGAIGTTSFSLRHDFVDPDDGSRYAFGIMTMVMMTATDRRPTPVPGFFREVLASAGPPAGLAA